ncbi:MAG: hypothetical protein K6T51_09770 [Rubrobacteraceae bacterium]|uniref:hypothetical protein n=1 Tax=Rubrobacter naiadicus TaxID=1392641 RepID=UPI002363170C|nr:hypothetical protein [Rubrobacter naiadicus]MBX6762836.1 hypothetical protein [Rubrobacteraceae bacterium]MCL6438887.1 hypothetical protein [Rubrobacteraceae bacterium]
MGEDESTGRGGYGSGAGPAWGKAVCGLGIFFLLAGLAMVTFGDRLSVSSYALGMICGLIGYGLGARRLGAATVAVSLVVLAFVLVASRGWVAGLNLPGLILVSR